jgi:hypothetical protein
MANTPKKPLSLFDGFTNSIEGVHERLGNVETAVDRVVESIQLLEVTFNVRLGTVEGELHAIRTNTENMVAAIADLVRQLKVTMSLTDRYCPQVARDVTNTEKVRKSLDARSNAHAVSISLSLTGFIVDQMLEGGSLLIQMPNGDAQKVVVAELAPLLSQKVPE